METAASSLNCWMPSRLTLMNATTNSEDTGAVVFSDPRARHVLPRSKGLRLRKLLRKWEPN